MWEVYDVYSKYYNISILNISINEIITFIIKYI